MSTKTKFILTFIGGFVAGIVFIFILGNIMSKSQNNDVVYFEQVGQVIPIKEFRVIQVLGDGSALAISDDVYHIGTVVVFPSDSNDSYYDDQRILIPKVKSLRQIGTYKYVTQQGMAKTVPIVQIFDK